MMARGNEPYRTTLPSAVVAPDPLVSQTNRRFACLADPLREGVQECILLGYYAHRKTLLNHARCHVESSLMSFYRFIAIGDISGASYAQPHANFFDRPIPMGVSISTTPSLPALFAGTAGMRVRSLFAPDIRFGARTSAARHAPHQEGSDHRRNHRHGRFNKCNGECELRPGVRNRAIRRASDHVCRARRQRGLRFRRAGQQHLDTGRIVFRRKPFQRGEQSIRCVLRHQPSQSAIPRRERPVSIGVRGESVPG